MKNRIDWVRQNCRLLLAIAEEFRRERPFAGKTIGTGIHLEPKTVALLLTLQAGGAKVVATGNLNTTQQSAVDYLIDRGVTVIGGPTRSLAEQLANQRRVLEYRPDLILDNGGDLFGAYLQDRYANLLGGTEETTSGRLRLQPLRKELRVPIIVINDSLIKQLAENEHAVGQSALESFIRITNRAVNGQRVTVFGYGAGGRGVAASMRGADAKVSVVDRDPLKRLRAHLDGFDTPARAAALASADLIVTVTGSPSVISAADLALFKDGVVIANIGHFPFEIDVAGIGASTEVANRDQFEDGIESLVLTDGRRAHVVAEGHMFNLAGPRPMGNSIESMDLGFALQARSLEAVALGKLTAADCVAPVPRAIDERVANAFLDLRYPRDA